MYAEERQHAMARLVTDRRRLSVTALADEFSVTTETVRRDLSSLERAGLVRRVHGGAVPVAALASIEAGLTERETHHSDAKDRIAAAALDLLPPDGSSVLLDAGSSISRLAGSIPRDRRLVVFTHAVPVAARLAALPGIDLHLLPGRVRPTTQAAVGPDTVAALDRLRADLVMVGTNALSLERGLTTPDADEAATKQALVDAGRRVVALADSSKIGSDSTIRFARLDQIDCLVTDDGIDTDDRAALERAGVEVIVA